MRGLLVALMMCVGVTPAVAQVTPEQQAQIAAYVRESNALAATGVDPLEVARARTQRLTASERTEAQAIFGSAFSVWQAGDYQSAEIGFRRGLEIDPANGAANFYMGDILRRRGDNAGARMRFSRTLLFAPNSAEALRAERALAELPTQEGIIEPPILFVPQTPQARFLDCSQCPEMITIPGGALVFDERRETIAPFAVGRFEITFAQWDACVAEGGCNGYRPSDEGWGRGNRPVINVSWNDAQSYVQWLSQRTGQRYRLLTGAEWEFAARAGMTAQFSWGEQDPVCDQNARNGANFSPCADDRSRPVGSFQPNPFGLYDVHGNVWEWVEDCSDSTCAQLIVRGGSWHNDAGWLSSVDKRVWGTPTARVNMYGFRVARTV
jgi:formylglycine-generating enzyme required for sulfatase activity